jgi:hypothetical protein
MTILGNLAFHSFRTDKFATVRMKETEIANAEALDSAEGKESNKKGKRRVHRKGKAGN